MDRPVTISTSDLDTKPFGALIVYKSEAVVNGVEVDFSQTKRVSHYVPVLTLIALLSFGYIAGLHAAAGTSFISVPEFCWSWTIVFGGLMVGTVLLAMDYKIELYSAKHLSNETRWNVFYLFGLVSVVAIFGASILWNFYFQFTKSGIDYIEPKKIGFVFPVWEADMMFLAILCFVGAYLNVGTLYATFYPIVNRMIVNRAGFERLESLLSPSVPA